MLRSVQANDTPQILTIEKLTQLSPWSADIFERCWNAGYLGWVIEKDNEVAGFIIASFQTGEAHILNLCVHPKFQRQGYGEQLIQNTLVVAKSKAHGVVFLEVRRSNKPAIGLYKKMDFIQIGERKNYYSSKEGREDALVFAIDTSTLEN